MFAHNLLLYYLALYRRRNRRELQAETRSEMPRTTRATNNSRRTRAGTPVGARVLVSEPTPVVSAAPTSTPPRVPPAVPVVTDDIIDLTQDSPSNAAFRQSRVLTEQNIEDSVLICEDDTPDPPNQPRRILKAKRRNLSKPAVIINLDDTSHQSSSPDISQSKSVPTNNNRNSSLTCPVCLDSLADENIKAMTTPCGHVYCADCLQSVTQERKRCCICQRPIKFSKCIRLHI